MEEEKAAAYYDELTRKGSGAARFKQGLGFSSDASGTSQPEGGSAFSSSSSFLSSFVRGPDACSVKSDKHSQLQSIQNKLKKKDSGTHGSDPGARLKERERERERDRDSRSRSRERDRDRSRRESRRRTRSRSLSDEDRRCRKDRERERRYRDRSSSPPYRSREKDRGHRRRQEDRLVKKDTNGAVDYAKLIQGYDRMTPAEKVKAKMKLQLSETVGKDTNMGSGSGWERFDFDKDAPIDNESDEEMEGAGNDAAVDKRLGQTFRFSNVQARRDNELKAAHDEAMFGAPIALSPSITLEREQEQTEDKETETGPNDESAAAAANNLLSEKVLAMKQSSWRDRARRKT